jgi:hypothetical protein
MTGMGSGDSTVTRDAEISTEQRDLSHHYLLRGSTRHSNVIPRLEDGRDKAHLGSDGSHASNHD